jgi:hypothetical protein
MNVTLSCGAQLAKQRSNPMGRNGPFWIATLAEAQSIVKWSKVRLSGLLIVLNHFAANLES